jgi:crotonobetainyl-CoA:carnitine CoA-transferase CaiB-like acyl-CoA transferase
MDEYKPLEGVKVVDLTYYVAGPAAARILADWGADVIKVEPPSGDPNRIGGLTTGAPCTDEINPYFTSYNINKRGIVLDLKTQEGSDIMDKLLSRANIFVTSFRPGALKRLGMDYAAMSKKYPHIIWASINGFGNYGPDKDNPGFDTVGFWARSGAMLDMMERDSAPVIPALAFGDTVTACSLSGGICAALYRQSKTGKGSCVNVSLLGQAVWNMSSSVGSSKYSSHKFPKSRKTPDSPLVNSYKTKDNKWIFVTVFDRKVFPCFLRAIRHEHLLDDERYNNPTGAIANSLEFTKLIENEFAKFTQDEIVEMLTKADVAHARIKTIAEVLNDPQVKANNYIIEYTHRNGEKTPISMSPITFGNSIEREVRHPSPLAGEHTEEVLQELGLTDEQIKDLEAKGAVYIRR